MKPVYIFRHAACVGPGYLGDFLENHGIPYKMICIDEDSHIPQQIDAVSGLIFMGGSMNVTDPLAWIDEEKKLILQADKQNIPVMGICLGAQLMSAALGATITHDPNMEIGWHAVNPCYDETKYPWLNALPNNNVPFHWHADSFSIPEGATPLFHSQCRQNQAYIMNNHIAIQFHPEMTSEMVEEWVRLFGSDLEQGHACAQSADEILNDLDNKIIALQQCADVFFEWWIKGLK